MAVGSRSQYSKVIKHKAPKLNNKKLLYIALSPEYWRLKTQVKTQDHWF